MHKNLIRIRRNVMKNKFRNLENLNDPPRTFKHPRVVVPAIVPACVPFRSYLLAAGPSSLKYSLKNHRIYDSEMNPEASAHILCTSFS